MFSLSEAVLEPEDRSGSMDLFFCFPFIIFSSLQCSLSFPFDFWLISCVAASYFHLCLGYWYFLTFVSRHFPFSLELQLNISFTSYFLFHPFPSSSYCQMFPEISLYRQQLPWIDIKTGKQINKQITELINRWIVITYIYK